MKRRLITALAAVAAIGVALPSFAQAPRKDFIWARSTTNASIHVDGILNEPVWATADSMTLQMAVDAGIPGSGWFYEAGIAPQDPTNATIRFLRVGNLLYLGAYIRDHSIGGDTTFVRADGLLMAIKDHSATARPAPPAEYFYTWWLPENLALARAPGAQPRFRGRWTGCNDNPPDCLRARTDAETTAWNAVTAVQGISNDDNNVDGDPNDDNDWGYTVEMKFDVGVMGYNYDQAQGDAVEWNLSIYDCDWNWPNQALFSANRVWWQDPWGNTAWYHNVRVLGRPDVTTGSGPAPSVGPDIRIPAADNYAAPTMDGQLTDAVWQTAPHFDIRYNDPALRATYPGEGPWRSGQIQFIVNGVDGDPDPIPTVQNRGDCTVRYFFKGDKLYLGFDVRDAIVQYYATVETRWDGFIVSINDYVARGINNHQLKGYKLTFQVGPGGTALAQHELPSLISQSGAQVVLHLKSTSPLDTLDRAASDVGYTAEMWIDLTKIGYPVGRGDGRIFLGIDLMDGDSFTNWKDSYGTRVWWQREQAGGSGADGGGPDGPAWGYLDPTLEVTGVDDGKPKGPTLALLGVRPNPFVRKTSVHFTLALPSAVTLQVYDLVGRRVASRDYGLQPAGAGQVPFDAQGLRSGLYTFRLRITAEEGGPATLLAGKMILAR
ncbi:MAG TPA: hypothetical protein VGK93_11105 [Candidatus Eisenbacteria bacterium]|jgi:hypothetical protein